MSPIEIGIVLFVLAFAITTLGATLAGVAAAVLAGKAGLSRPAAVMAGAKAFGGTLTMAIALAAVIIGACK
ncbi:hypothetical protein E1293_28450 [Actinomadura darangshiensis]|uniref:Uncharacterized protein n=1 Tax=Actinomadura darangshiensis TaxID=705336 RepID=A0A4R5AXG9_9ACTN|nr:hypothetical protein [Actinomadura darangshiensis]TDD75372.1 hypothetical protein E1293_28450 [Actinomadura darangshiensis]